MSHQLPAPWQDDQPNADEDDGTIPAVVLEYKTPTQRAKLALEKSLVIACGSALLVGLLEMLKAYALETVMDQRTLVTMFLTLIITVAMTGLKKYADAAGEEGFSG